MAINEITHWKQVFTEKTDHGHLTLYFFRYKGRPTQVLVHYIAPTMRAHIREFRTSHNYMMALVQGKDPLYRKLSGAIKSKIERKQEPK